MQHFASEPGVFFSRLSHFFGSASGDSAEQRKEVLREEDREEVFTVELHRGPHGLGLALVDGTVRITQC